MLKHWISSYRRNGEAGRPALTRYGCALLLVVLAIAIRWRVDPLIGHPSVAIFMAAILLGSWLGGVGPAIVCLVLLHIAHGFYFQSVPGLWEGNLASAISIVGWYAIGITVGILSRKRAYAQWSAEVQQRKATTHREQLRTTVSCMADGVLVCDHHGIVTLLNRAAEELADCSAVHALGRPWNEILRLSGGDGSILSENLIDRVLSDRVVVHDRSSVNLISHAGQVRPISFSAAPIRIDNDQITGVVVVLRDESERRRIELALQEADRRKDEFLATLAHELRNPLAPICMGMELLEMTGDDPQAATDIRSMVQRQAQHMVRLVDDLLDVSRITRGKLQLRRAHVELSSILDDGLAAARPLLDEADHRLTTRLPERQVRLFADANRLTQVFTNILNNAAKYTPRGGRIELAVNQTNDEVSIAVADNGIGIPSDKLHSVFDLFSQVHKNGESRQSGLGIGLTLVKRLVEMHGGSVTIQSGGRDLGTKVVVRLPVSMNPESQIESPEGKAATARLRPRRRVLVVDDNVDALESLSRMVALLGDDVRQAHDGLEAVEIARTFRPDIVLMDLGMPRLNGFDAARLLRQEPWAIDLALVATTGWGQEEDRRRSADAGFDRHLVKPIAMSALREVLEAA